jgi:hypothetical protein
MDHPVHSDVRHQTGTGTKALRWMFVVMGWFYLVTLLQLVAAFAGVQHYTHWHWSACAVLALAVGWIPIIGTTAAMYGATQAWSWHSWVAGALFLWPLLLLPLLVIAKQAGNRR